MTTAWWNSKALHQLNAAEWESLCDGCGKCCLHKLEDEEDGTVYTTAVACKLLDCATARCSDYFNRKPRVPGCIVLRVEDIAAFSWLPPTCAYRLREQNQALPDWHPLITGDANSTRKRGHSVAGRCISARDVHPDDFEEQVIDWY
jgi:hypothetical protein